MLKFIAAAILSLSLTACASTGGAPPSTSQITDAIKQVQSYTALACKFVPTVATVASIFSSGASSIAAIAQDICNAVSTAPLADGGTRRAYVRGVRVRGSFVR